MNRLESQRYFRREDAVNIVAKLAESKVYANMHGSGQGWQITLNGHTDLTATAKVLDTIKVQGKPGVSGTDGTEQPVQLIYRPYGGEGWPDVLIFWGPRA